MMTTDQHRSPAAASFSGWLGWGWGQPLPEPALVEHLTELRRQMLHLLIVLTAAACLLWMVGRPQVVSTRGELPAATLGHWLLGLAVLGGWR